MELLSGADILENFLLELSPQLLGVLLKDHTMSTPEEQRNIFWATHDYEELGAGYQYDDPILPELITGENGNVIMPRTLKDRAVLAGRIRDMAEVFTPSWVCNLQNNQIDREWFGRDDVFNHQNADNTWEGNPDKIVFPEGKTWRDYVSDVRMEITCGEAPYMVSRYDSTTSEEIPLQQRIGLLDRKLRVVSENTTTSKDWLEWARTAYRSVYGFEWQGDNLLIARENILMTFADYYRAKFNRNPQVKSLQYVAYLVSWNFWQMDGLKGVVPNTCGHTQSEQMALFGEREICECPGCQNDKIRDHNGTYCLIRDWQMNSKNNKIRFIDLLPH